MPQGPHIDPVCSMEVEPAEAAGSSTFKGTTYYFCNPHCKKKFDAAPQKYLSKQDASAPPAQPDPHAHAASALYGCPMHPEVEKIGPGSCPKCGMALEPVDGGEDDGSEYRDLSSRFWLSLVFTVPLVVLAMSEMVSSLSQLIPSHLMLPLQLLLALPVVAWGGLPFFRKGWESVRHRSPNMFTLIALGTGVAFLYSAFVTVTGGAAHGGHAAVYFEASAVIILLVLLGQLLELRARERTSDAIRALVSLAPKTARRIQTDGSEEEVALERIQVADKLHVRPGEAIPLDGVVLSGHSDVNEAIISGESLPVEKSVGQRVTGGTMNGSGAFTMEVTRTGADTVLAQIIKAVRDARKSRVPVQQLADKVAAWFVPAVLVVAAASFVGWFLAGSSIAAALTAAIAVLIIACPCALGLATPMSVVVATGRGALSGILVRNAAALQSLERVDLLVIDKTGTLTQGKPELKSVATVAGMSETEALSLAAAVEQHSEHPLARAIVAALKGQAPVAEDFRYAAGKGVSATVNGRRVIAGNPAYLSESGISISGMSLSNSGSTVDCQRWITLLSASGHTAIAMAVEGQLAAVFALADKVKKNAAETVSTLRGQGVRVVIVTGDNAGAAEAVAREVGISEVFAGVLPHEKSRIVERFKTEGRIVAMAGDGVNDAPALAAADVGIAMGNGTDVAMSTAAIVLLQGDLSAIVRARALSKAMMRNIRQNLILAFGYNVLAIPIAAGLLYPLFGLLLNPMIASAAMSLSSVSVIINALRLRRATHTG